MHTDVRQRGDPTCIHYYKPKILIFNILCSFFIHLQMVAIYKDPEAKSIFSLNFTSHSDRLKSSLSNKNEK